MNIDVIDRFITSVDMMLDTKSKRHIIGGIFLSASLLFGGLAATVFTIRGEENYDE